MPFYEYECPSCRYYLEVLQKITDRPLKKCPSCGKAGFKRLVSAPVFRLKGSGWYETDFKTEKDSKRNLAGADREDAKATSPEAKASAPASAKDDKSGAKAEAKAPAGAGSAEKPAPRSKKAAPARGAARSTRSSARPASRRAARPAARRKGGR